MQHDDLSPTDSLDNLTTMTDDQRELHNEFVKNVLNAYHSLYSLQKYLEVDRDRGHIHGVNALNKLHEAFQKLGIRP